jgi:hypothetical protein
MPPMTEDFEKVVVLIQELFETENLNLSIGTEPTFRIIFEPDSKALDKVLETNKMEKEKFRLFEQEISELMVAIFTGIGINSFDETKLNIVRKKFFGRSLRHHIISKIEDTEKEFEHHDWSLQVSSIENTVNIVTSKMTFRPIIASESGKQKIFFKPNEIIEGNQVNLKKEDLGKEQSEMTISTSPEERVNNNNEISYKIAFKMMQKNLFVTLTLLILGILILLLNPLIGVIFISWGIANSFLSIYFLWKETGILVINSRLVIFGAIVSICLLIFSLITGLFLRQGHYWYWIG